MKLKLFIFQLFFFLATGVALADEPAQYDKINPQPTASGDKIEVIEFFWYGCPHCYSLEPYLEKWLETKPDDVVFRRIPAVLGSNWIHYAKVYYAADKLGVVDKLHTPLFNAIHQQRMLLDDATRLGDFLESLGIDKDKFFTAYQSEEVSNQIKNAYIMGQDYGLTGVPTVIVNGKYRTSASQAGSNEKLIQVLNELIQMERGGTGNAAPPQAETTKPAAMAPSPAPPITEMPMQSESAEHQKKLRSMLMIAAGVVAMIVALALLLFKGKSGSNTPAE